MVTRAKRVRLLIPRGLPDPFARAQTFLHENRESPVAMGVVMTPIRAVKAEEAVDRHARVGAVGGGRRTDEAPKAAAEVTEGRSEPKGNSVEPTTSGILSPGRVSSGLQGVRAVATRDKQIRFTALLHHLSVGMLEDAYRALNPQAAAGVDQVTWSQYGGNLRPHIVALHARVHGGRYRAQPSRRVWIPKADGQQRPLGVAALEDQIVQGFTHICGKRRSDGGFAVWRHSVGKRLNQKVSDIGKHLKAMRSLPIAERGRWIRRVVQGWMAYHAIPTNSVAINRFRDRVVDAWRRALRQRSHMARRLTWKAHADHRQPLDSTRQDSASVP